MPSYGVQLYTLRNLDESLEVILETLSAIGYDAVEFAGIGDEPVADVEAALGRTGLSVAGAHVGIDRLESDLDAVLDEYAPLGCDRFVVPSYDHEAFETRAGVSDAVADLSALADRVADRGYELHYHNHVFEFADVDGRPAFDRFVAESTDALGLEVDVGLAAHAGIDPVALLGRHADRISLVHLTDTVPDDDGSLHVDLGTGVVDVEGCLDAATAIDADHVLFEHGQSADSLTSVRGAATRIAAFDPTFARRA